MIQRIQSVFLLVAAGAALGLFGVPMADTDEPVSASALFADTQFEVQDHWALMAAFGLCGLILLVAIFLFRNRRLQMTVTLSGVILALVGAGIGLFFFLSDTAASAADPALGMGFPLLAAAFGILAYSNINKDEKLVRSADRLR